MTKDTRKNVSKDTKKDVTKDTRKGATKDDKGYKERCHNRCTKYYAQKGVLTLFL